MTYSSYERILQDHLDTGVITRSDRILVQFAGAFDESVTGRLGLTNCVLANVAPDSPSSRILGTKLDAHSTPFRDCEFDGVVMHAGLHHCSRPHQALYEMYRIAERYVVFVENQDSFPMRCASRVGLAKDFEIRAVIDGGYTSGGVDGTGVPNYVYRWTRREVLKTVRAFDPGRRVPVEFHAEWNVSRQRGDVRPSARTRLLNAALNSAMRRSGNILAVTIRKDLATEREWMASLREGLDGS